MSDQRPVATIKLVATEAGVSVGTVSNALNNPDKVAPATLARVRDAIERVGFIRNSAARSLAMQRNEGIGLIVPDIANSFFVEIARGAQSTARELGLNLLLANSGFSLETMREDAEHPDQQDGFLDYFAEARTSGILVSSMRDPRAGIERIRDHVQPIVVINYDSPDADWCTVLMDNERVGREAIEHLATTGKRLVHFITPDADMQPIHDRRRGIHEAASRLGVRVIETESSDLWTDGGRRAMRQLLQDRPDEPFAILAITDAAALGALEVLRGRPDIRVPDDIAVLGLDGNHHAEASDWITLSSFELPGYEMGVEAIRLLQDEGRGPGHRHTRVTVPAAIRPRGSTVTAARG